MAPAGAWILKLSAVMGFFQVHGVQHTGLMLCRLIVHQQLAVVCDLAAAGEGGQHAEILRAGGDVDICPASGCQSADFPVQIESPRAVDGDHLNGLDKVQTHAQGRAQRVVQMAPLLQVHRVQVVGDDADHGGVQMIFHHGLQQHRHIPGGAALAHHQVAAVAQPLEHILFAEGLMVGGHTGGNAGAHGRAVHIRQMALQGLAGHGQRGVKGLQQIGEPGCDIGADTLGQAHRVRTLQGLADDLRIKAPAAGLQIGGKRHVGRHHEINFQVCGLGLLQDGLDALQPGHHAHLVQVRHNAGGAVCQHRLGKGPDGQRGAFRMDMSVQEAGGQILSLRVHHPGALADTVFHIAHGSDGVAADGHAAVIDLTGIDIDHLAVPDHQIGRSLTLRNGQ